MPIETFDLRNSISSYCISEIGAGIEEGTNDIIDGVDNAIEGNDNNSGDMTRGRKIR